MTTTKSPRSSPQDAVTEGTAGRTEGRENIRRLYQSYQVTPFAFHRVTNPIIKVAGNLATGNWHVLVALTRPGNQAVWVGRHLRRGIRANQRRLADQDAQIHARLHHAV